MQHHHQMNTHNRAFAIGIALNVLFIIIEGGYGIVADSLALLADAGHNISDVLSLLLAWGASYLATKQPTRTRTYGFRRVPILTSLLSAILLLVALGGITWEALGRLSSPQSVNTTLVIVVAGIGVIINTATALLFISGQKQDLNIRAAFLHMAADAGISLGVVVAGFAIMMTNWLWLDPVISLVIVLVILIGTWHLLKESINLSIDAVPQGIDVSAITDYLSQLHGVTGIHDLHVWALSTSQTALTVHLISSSDLINNDLLQETQAILHDNHGIDHATIQIERATDESSCSLNHQQCIQQ